MSDSTGRSAEAVGEITKVFYGGLFFFFSGFVRAYFTQGVWIPLFTFSRVKNAKKNVDQFPKILEANA